MPGPVAIGIDVGGTKTHLVIESGPEQVADLVVPTRSWWLPGSPIERPGNAVALLAALPTHGDAGSALVIGAHGVDSAGSAERMTRELAGRFPGSVKVLNDAALAGPAAGYLGPVITVIAGTGSIVLALDPNGVETRIGGHGYLLGDEGSAPALVRDLAREVLRAADRGQPDAIALTHLADAAGVRQSPERAADLAAALHHNCLATTWGALAPAVFAAAQAGSPLALGVIQRHAGELVELVELHLAAGTHPEAVVLAGGVATAQPRLTDAIITGINFNHPELPVVVLDRPPVAGAILLARMKVAGAVSTGSAASAPEPSTTRAQQAAPSEGN